MRLIQNRRNRYIFLSATCSFLTLCLFMKPLVEGAFIFAAITFVFFILLIRQNRLVREARLIQDNQIIAIPSAKVSVWDGPIKKDAGEILISTFGILTKSEIYPWGLNGLNGVRLLAAQIDREKIYMTFGNAHRTTKIELLHGMTKKKAVLDVSQKLLYETGIKVDTSGW